MARGSWGQSKLLTQKSWTIVKDNRYLLAFPVLGFLASLVPLAMFWIPAGYLAISDQYAGVGHARWLSITSVTPVAALDPPTRVANDQSTNKP